MSDSGQETPRRLPLFGVTSEGNGSGARDRRAEDANNNPREQVARAERAIPAGLSPVQYARIAAVNSYRAAESAASAHETTGKILREQLAHRDDMARAHVGLSARVDALTSALGHTPLPPLPAPRERAVSVADFDELMDVREAKELRKKVRGFRETASTEIVKGAVGLVVIVASFVVGNWWNHVHQPAPIAAPVHSAP